MVYIAAAAERARTGTPHTIALEIELAIGGIEINELVEGTVRRAERKIVPQYRHLAVARDQRHVRRRGRGRLKEVKVEDALDDIFNI
jgi:hypothetical protein